MDCNVCCLPYNKRTRKKVKCLKCNLETCSSCCERYILENVNEAHCMGCKQHWDREFLIDNMSYSFVDKKYKKHRQDLLLDRQMAMMEETQAIIEQRKEVEKYDMEIENINQMIRELVNRKQELRIERDNLMYSEKVVTKGKIKFYGHCPIEDCKGFINSSWKCGICDIKVCKSCKEQLTPEEIAIPETHECNPETLETLNRIKKDCRNCPKCKVSIQRIQGCSQMWCTQCHTAFDWRTGNIVIGNIHNPHYDEWKRNNGDNNTNGNDNENGCVNVNRILNIYFYRAEYFVHNNAKNQFNSWVYNIFQFLRHIRFHEMPYINGLVNEEHKELELRIQYLSNKIDKNTFKQKIQQIDKKKSKYREFYMIMDMFTQTSIDIIISTLFKNVPIETLINMSRYPTSIPEKVISLKDVTDSIESVNKLVDYANNSIEKIQKKYKNKMRYIKQDGGRIYLD